MAPALDQEQHRAVGNAQHGSHGRPWGRSALRSRSPAGTGGCQSPSCPMPGGSRSLPRAAGLRDPGPVASIPKDPQDSQLHGLREACGVPGPAVYVRSKGGLRDSSPGPAPPPPALLPLPGLAAHRLCCLPVSTYLFSPAGVLPPGGPKRACRALAPSPLPPQPGGPSRPSGNDWTEGPTPRSGHIHILKALVPVGRSWASGVDGRVAGLRAGCVGPSDFLLVGHKNFSTCNLTI